MKRLNITKAIDQFGWSYYFLGTEQKKLSRHNIVLNREALLDNLGGIDVLYIHSPDMSPAARAILPERAKRAGIKVIGAYGGLVRYVYPQQWVDIVSTISPQTYQFAKESYPGKPVIFLPESIDDDFFRPAPDKHYGFRVGFAGRLSDVKRPKILDSLKYPVIKQSEWGKQFFLEGRSLDPMLKFYNSIDVLVLVSKSEGMPRVVLEAMACGIPVVSTEVGSLGMMIEKEWLVNPSIENDQAVVEAVNEKLDRLESDPELRKRVGIRNRLRVENFLSWKANSALWDATFDAVYEGDYKKATSLSDLSLARLCALDADKFSIETPYTECHKEEPSVV